MWGFNPFNGIKNWDDEVLSLFKLHVISRNHLNYIVSQTITTGETSYSSICLRWRRMFSCLQWELWCSVWVDVPKQSWSTAVDFDLLLRNRACVIGVLQCVNWAARGGSRCVGFGHFSLFARPQVTASNSLTFEAQISTVPGQRRAVLPLSSSQASLGYFGPHVSCRGGLSLVLIPQVKRGTRSARLVSSPPG